MQLDFAYTEFPKQFHQLDILTLYNHQIFLAIILRLFSKIKYHQKYGVTPDIITLAKAFGGGMPLGAFVASKRIMDTLQENPALGHITTFGGHPVCCAAGLAAFRYLKENHIVEDVERKGALYEELLKDHPAVLEIRRSGLLLAVELGTEERLFKVMELFKEEGIMSDWFLYCATAFRISPPLVITDEEIRESVEIIRRVLDKL